MLPGPCSILQGPDSNEQKSKPINIVDKTPRECHEAGNPIAVFTPELSPRVDVVATAKKSLAVGEYIDGLGGFATY